MGGKGALSAWMREFTALVFTQTIQAFIYAIIISIILLGMVKDGGTVVSNNNSENNAAVGLMSTFALLSVFKVESMARKIFGVGDTKASPGSAMKSIAKTAIAAKIGKRALDNAGKVFGGVGAIGKAGADRAKTKKRLREDMEDNGFKLGDDGKPFYVGNSKRNNSASPSTTSQPINVNPNGSQSDADANVSGTSTMGASTINSSGISDGDMRRVKNALRSYEDKMSEIKKARNEGIKSIVTGVTESVGAAVGGTMGGILGGSDGNVDELIQGIMAGMGTGDALAQQTVNITDKTLQFVGKRAKSIGNFATTGKINYTTQRSLQREIDKYKDALGSQEVRYGSSRIEDTDY